MDAAQSCPGLGRRALLCPDESEDPAFRRAGRLPNLRYGDQIRAVWVTRYDFESDEDIVQIMQRSAQAGFNTVFFQVRGNATTYYPSKLEPWSEVYGWKSPGFNPLQLAINEAHARHMALHAWINVMPMWRGTSPPTNENHLYWRHPEWSWYDRHGVRQPLNRGFYVSINPCLLEARDHIVGICQEIVSSYQVDGLHLDYIRFPNEPPVANGKQYSQDKRTLDLFLSDTGFTVEERPDLWNQWRCDCVTALLRDIRRTVKSLRPQMILSAAVGAERKQALGKFQDVEQWWKERLLDAMVPMNYTICHKTFRNRVEHEWQQNTDRDKSLHIASRRKVRSEKGIGQGPVQLVKDSTYVEWARPPEPAIVMGASVEFGDGWLHQKQLALALQRFGHFSVFCYSSLFGLKKHDNKHNVSLLAFLRVLADASQVFNPSWSASKTHPFAGNYTSAHPEESFPYDQLHFYEHVPLGVEFRPPVQSKLPAQNWKERQRQRQKGAVRDNRLKCSRRTCRRNLFAKETKEVILNLDTNRRQQKFSGQLESTRLLAKTSEDYNNAFAMKNWEALKMKEATTGELQESRKVFVGSKLHLQSALNLTSKPFGTAQEVHLIESTSDGVKGMAWSDKFQKPARHITLSTLGRDDMSRALEFKTKVVHPVWWISPLASAQPFQISVSLEVASLFGKILWSKLSLH